MVFPSTYIELYLQDRLREFTHWVYQEGNIASHAAGYQAPKGVSLYSFEIAHLEFKNNLLCFIAESSSWSMS